MKFSKLDKAAAEAQEEFNKELLERQRRVTKQISEILVKENCRIERSEDFIVVPNPPQEEKKTKK